MTMFMTLSSPAQTLILQYTYNEGTGTTVADSSGFGTAANATMSGNTSIANWSSNTPGAPGFSAQIFSPGANHLDTINTSSSPSKLNSLTAFTVTTWINPQSQVLGGNRIFSTRGNGSFTGIDWFFGGGVGSSTNGTLVLVLGGNSTNYSSTVGTLTLDGSAGWLFLAATWDTSTSTLKYYVGDPSTSVSQYGANVTTASIASTGVATGNLFIGSTNASPQNRTPNALFDDTRVYNGVLDLTALEGVRLAAVPEPGTAVLWGVGLSIALCFRRRIAALAS